VALALAAAIIMAAPAATAADPAPGSAIGTAGPLVVLGHAPDRRWVAFCQAREDTDGDGHLGVRVGFHGETQGDALRPYIAVGDGPGTPIDDFVGATPDGRVVALVEGGRLLLWDTVTNVRVDLSATGATLPEDGGSLGPGGFDPRGTRFLYYDGDGPHRRAVVRDLASGEERVVDHGIGNLYRAALADGGEHVFVWTWPTGAKLRLPRTTLGPRTCRGPVTSSSASGSHLLNRELVRVDGGPFAASDALAIVDGRLLARTDGGELVWESSGRPRAALPRRMGGLVLGVGASRGLVVAAPVGDESEIRWVGPRRQVVRTGWRRPHPTQDWVSISPRIWVGWPDEGTSWLVDLKTGAHMVAEHQSHSPGAYGDRVLFLREHVAVVADIGAGRVTELTVPIRQLGPSFVRGRWAAATIEGPGAVVLDLDAVEVVGQVSGGSPEGLADDGSVLVPAAPAPREGLPMGPLAWRRPAVN